MYLQFKAIEDNLYYTINSIRLLKLNVNNKFFSQSNVQFKNDVLIPNSNLSNLQIDCTAAASDNLNILQHLAITCTPIKCRMSLENSSKIYGIFFISYYSHDNSTGDIPEISFKLKSSGEYAINK